MKRPFFQLALPLSAAALLAASLGRADNSPEAAAEQPQPWEVLFDGKSLFGWSGDPNIWTVEDGAIVGRNPADKPIEGNTFLVWQGGDLADFELSVDFKLESGNSGIQYRSETVGSDWVMKGYQADFHDGEQYSGIVYEEKGRGILAQRGERNEIGEDGKPKNVGKVGDSAEINSHIKKGDWNTYEVIARGRHIIHMINGVITAEIIDKDPNNFRDRGKLGFQVHAGPPMEVRFKNIKVRRHKPEGKKKIVFFAGRPSHASGDHEHRAGSLLLANQINKHAPEQLYAEVHIAQAWPDNIKAIHDADAIVFYCDGGGGHMANDHLEELGLTLAGGCGIACLHYGVETTKGEKGDQFLKWLGGYFEPHWSVNPHWDAEFKELPDHPITNGVKPFTLRDEWYFNMRFVPNMEGVTPILSAIPDESTIERPDGPHSGNPHVREAVKNKELQHVAWAYERPDGGRSFGFTGGHFHKNWGHRDFRTVVLNALAWISKAEVPENGIPSDDLTEEDLIKNLD